MASLSTDFEDSTYSSTSEAEPDSDRDDDDDDNDPQKLLGTWLGELESLKLGLDSVGSGMPTADKSLFFATPRIDSYRFSMANLEDSQDVELDAILGELCALENQFDREIFSGSRGHQRSVSSVSQSSGVSSLDSRSATHHHHHHHQQQQLHAASSTIQSLCSPAPFSAVTQRFSSHNRSSSAGVPAANRPKFELSGLQSVDDGGRMLLLPNKAAEVGSRTDSPDNDSAFSDTVSMLSSESSASSGGGGGGGVGLNGVPRQDHSSQNVSSKSSNMSLALSPTQLNAEHAARIKAEKIKIALEKIREASVKKLFIKAFTADGSAKSLLIDEKMSVGYVARLLVDKNHVKLDLRWSIVEHIPELYMERVFEDHENLVENLMLWTRDSKNRLLFLERSDKYDHFYHPEHYFLVGHGSRQKAQEFDDDCRASLIEEFFSGSVVSVPEVEGLLYLKSDGKKAWKKHFFVLRASGLYYCPKGKSKLPKDLVCLVTFDVNNVYIGVGWKKKHKAPTEFGFAIKHPQVQTKACKYIKYLCAEDEESLRQWVVGIRIAKFGRQLLDNYRMLIQDIAEDDLDTLAHARSFSISSVARSGTSSMCTTPSAPTTPTYDTTDAPPPRTPSSSGSSSEPPSSSATPVSTLERGWGKHSVARQDSVRSSSTSGSGATSERSGNGTPTGGSELYGFECDFPTGTIKRKPSVNPKIPLTSTTRALAKQSLADDEFPSTEGDEVPLVRNGTLRKKSLRRSLTEDRIAVTEVVSTLRRQQSLLRHENRGFASPTLEHSAKVGVSEFDAFPPPPPEFAASMESLLSVDSLPLPPPPEAYKSNLSLDSLPPPPVSSDCPGGDTASPNSQPAPETFSRAAAPPVPPPKPSHRPATTPEVYADDVTVVELAVTTPKGGKYDMPLSAATELPGALHNGYHNVNGHDGSSSSDAVVVRQRLKSPGICRRITFRDEVAVLGRGPPPPPPLPPAVQGPRPRTLMTSCLFKKPAPPLRSESTRLSIGQRQAVTAELGTLTRSQITSPKIFLADLQRVMEKKWKVAQQLKGDLNSSPHTVMGFRDPPLPSDVLCCGAHIDEKNRVAAAAAAAAAAVAAVRSPTTPSSPSSKGGAPGESYDEAARVSACSAKKKLPPPPPPKRSETTQLTSRTQ